MSESDYTGRREGERGREGGRDKAAGGRGDGSGTSRLAGPPKGASSFGLIGSREAETGSARQPRPWLPAARPWAGRLPGVGVREPLRKKPPLPELTEVFFNFLHAMLTWLSPACCRVDKLSTTISHCRGDLD